MISAFVPAFNEEKNIADTLNALYSAAQITNLEIEVIVVNDGSKDKTADIVNSLVGTFPRLVLVNNETNLGMGKSMRKALAIARYDRFVVVPGDNDMAIELLVSLFSNVTRAELVMAYFLNQEIRGIRRNVISTIFGSIYMITFGIFVRYINGPCIYPTSKLRSFKLRANRFSIVVEAVTKTLRSGATFYEVPGYMQKGLAGSTSLSWQNLIEVFWSYLRLVYEIKIINRGRFSYRPKRIYH